MKLRFAIRNIVLFYFGLLAIAAPLPAQAQPEPPPLSAYGNLPDVEVVVLSPSGARLAALTADANGQRTLAIFDADKRLLKGFELGDAKVRSIEFVTEDLILLRQSLTKPLPYNFVQDKFELFQAVLVSLDSDELKLVFADRYNLVHATFGYYGMRKVNGRPKAYFGALEVSIREGFRHGRRALYEVDLLTNISRKVDNSADEGYLRSWLVDGAGYVFARLDINLETGESTIRNASSKVLVSGKDENEMLELGAISQTGTSVIFYQRNPKSGVIESYEVPVDGGGEPTPFLSDVYISDLYTDRDTGRLVGYLADDDAIGSVFFDPAKAEKARMIRKAFPKLYARMVDWTASLDQAIVNTNGNGDSGTFYLVDVPARRADAIAYERPAIGLEHVGAISTVVYTASDGLEMDGILTLPPGREPKNLPVVMLPHWGPHSHDIEGFDWWAQAYASRGYAVFQPNFRGSTNRSESFVQAGYGEWGGKMQSDISDGLAMLAEKGIVDPSRACIVGAGYGGYAALAGVTLQQGLYRCAVSFAGISDIGQFARFEYWQKGGDKLWRRLRERQLGPKSRYKDISPRHHANKADAPIMLIHGRDDTVVAYDQSLKMADALKDAGKPYEFVELKGEDHWLSLGETRKAMLEAAVDFVQRHNPAN